jgi:hypothetical protein
MRLNPCCSLSADTSLVEKLYSIGFFNDPSSYDYIVLNVRIIVLYSKTCLKRNLKGPEHFSSKARFPLNQGTLHIKIKPGHICI